MVTDMELHALASLLRRGRSLDQLSTGLGLLGAVLGLGSWWVPDISPWAVVLGTVLLILGVLQKYWAVRVAFDADLFQRVADSAEPLSQSADSLDLALAGLGLQPSTRGGRSWNERRDGALTLLRRQAILLAAQVLLTLCSILASPWQIVAG